MDIDTILRLILALLFTVFITYTITSDYFRRILKLQHEYIKDLQKENADLDKDNKKLHDDLAGTLNHMNASIEILGNEVMKFSKYKDQNQINDKILKITDTTKERN